MSKFEDFILSDAFFPVLIILLLLLVGVFIWIIINNNKKYYRRKTKEQINNNDYSDLSDIASVSDEEFENLLYGNNLEMPELKKEEKVIEPIINESIENKIIEEKRNEQEIKPLDIKVDITQDVNQFPDFSSIEDLTKKEEKESSKVEDDVMDAAKKYIESIMAKK